MIPSFLNQGPWPQAKKRREPFVYDQPPAPAPGNWRDRGKSQQPEGEFREPFRGYSIPNDQGGYNLTNSRGEFGPGAEGASLADGPGGYGYPKIAREQLTGDHGPSPATYVGQDGSRGALTFQPSLPEALARGAAWASSPETSWTDVGKGVGQFVHDTLAAPVMGIDNYLRRSAAGGGGISVTGAGQGGLPTDGMDIMGMSVPLVTAGGVSMSNLGKVRPGATLAERMAGAADTPTNALASYANKRGGWLSWLGGKGDEDYVAPTQQAAYDRMAANNARPSAVSRSRNPDAPRPAMPERPAADGMPSTVYHGTRSDFDQYDHNVVYRGKPPGHIGVFVTPDEKWAAAKHATPARHEIEEGLSAGRQMSPAVKKLTLDRGNYFNGAYKPDLDALADELNASGVPFNPEYLQKGYWSELENPKVVEAMKALGYDGARMFEDVPTAHVWSRGKLTYADDPDKVFFANRGSQPLAGAAALARPQELPSLPWQGSPATSFANKGGEGVGAANALAMDDASRMARARDMGFDTDSTWWHGSSANDITEFEPGRNQPGVWFTTDMQNASSYAKGSDGGMYKTYLKTEKPFVVTSASEDRFIPMHDGRLLEQFDNNDDIARYAFRNGYDATHFPDGNFTESGNTMTIRDGHQIRDVDAAFDPANSSSANILAANRIPSLPWERRDDRPARTPKRYGGPR